MVTPLVAPDPFRYADNFYQQQERSARQNDNDTQQSLLNMFTQEAATQRPYATLPARLALSNAEGEAGLGRSMRLARYGSDLSLRNAMYKQANKVYAPDQIASTIKAAAKMYGVDPDLMLSIAEVESGFDPRAQNPGSSAGGLFQQIDDNAKQYGVANKFDPSDSSDGAARYIRDITGVLSNTLGRPPTKSEVYLAYQQGPGGGAKLLQAAQANPNMPAEQVVGLDAVLKNGGRRGMSVGQFVQLWTQKFDKVYQPRATASSKQPMLVYGNTPTLGNDNANSGSNT